MHAGEQQPVLADLTGAQQFRDESAQFESSDDPPAVTPRRLWAALAWIAGCVVLFVFFLRISLSSPTNSDSANIALQAWDLLHGHILLHGWILSDASFYTFDQPVIAFSELLFGLDNLASHVASALCYGIVAVSTVALAMTNSRGPARLARCGVAIAMLAVPLLVLANVRIALGPPDHMGTSVFLLVSFLLIDRAPGKRYTAPLLCVILCAGQLGDATVRFVAVPAIVLVCAYRVLAARKIRVADTVIALAAIASVPLEILVRAAMRHFGSFLMVAPPTRLAPLRQWPHNATLTLHAVRQLFGAVVTPEDPLGLAGTVFGSICMFAALAGLVKVIVTWRSASRAEQFLCAAIVANIAAYQITTDPRIYSAYEMSAVLPCGAVLASRAVVPATISGLRRARIAAAAVGVAALLPLAAAASVPPATGFGNTTGLGDTLIPWLEAHHLSYGLASYWNSSAITMQAGNKVALRTIFGFRGHDALIYDWETNILWYDPSRYDASFVVVQRGDPRLTAAQVTRAFGKPVSVHRVANWEIMIYERNLLKQVRQPPLPSVQ
jgi:hypothetical protein